MAKVRTWNLAVWSLRRRENDKPVACFLETPADAEVCQLLGIDFPDYYWSPDELTLRHVDNTGEGSENERGRPASDS